MYRFLGIQAKNRKEWGISHMGNFHSGTTTIALYDTLGVEAAKYVINQTELTTIALQGDLAANIIKMKQEEITSGETNAKMQTLTSLIVFDQVDDDCKNKARDASITIYHFDDVIAKGKERIAKGDWKPTEPTPEDCPMFCYTSGTTGDPKGVKLTHRALCGTAASVQLWLGADILGEKDTYISYLPAAHSFEAVLFAMSVIYGVRCGYFGGNILDLVSKDLPLLKPTFFPSVPRLYNKIFSKLKANIDLATGVKAWLVKKAVASKMANLKSTGAVTHGCYDKIVFKKMKMLMGGNIRLMLTGSAPISGEVLDFLKICFCCPIVEGYGMTETSAGSILVRIGDPECGYIGGPVCNVKIKIRDIPEMGYLSTNDPPKGELCLKGPSIMKSYYKNEEKTDEMLSEDGWLFSGDVIMVHPNGAIQIIDRAKNIFKLSQGEYIAPEKLENEFINS
jgi:long-chain acyl-CoA synthetase